MKKEVLSTIKSSETDDYLDTRVVRPLAYLCACLFAKLNLSPNTVTVISMFVGAASALFFLSGSFYYAGAVGVFYNIIAFLLLATAAVLDCTDGQLARMTGKTSRLGRILDGIAGFTWYVPIYFCLILRFYNHHDIEFNWFGIEDTPENILMATVFIVFLIGVSGFFCLAEQSRVADYYIQTHLFFLKGEKGSELENSTHLKQMYDEMPWEGNKLWKTFLKTYINYTKLQEKKTPQFQALMQRLKLKYGSSDNFPSEIRQQFHQHSKPLMKLVPLLTFNFRTIVFIVLCLLDIPIEYFVFEIVVMTILSEYCVHRHEKFCKELCRQ